MSTQKRPNKALQATPVGADLVVWSLGFGVLEHGRSMPEGGECPERCDAFFKLEVRGRSATFLV